VTWSTFVHMIHHVSSRLCRTHVSRASKISHDRRALHPRFCNRSVQQNRASEYSSPLIDPSALVFWRASACA
jgi:hypothetical protein